MAAVRKFALPVERPGGRYITRIQMKRMKEAAIEAAKFSEKESGLFFAGRESESGDCNLNPPITVPKMICTAEIM
eukprot:1383171-Amorphochlora_amoeboformis.AAC.1